MKFLYGINTVGQGHINRSRTIINQLKRDGNLVDCVFSGPEPPKYAQTLGDRRIIITGYHIKFNSNFVDTAKTFVSNIINMHHFPKNTIKVYKFAKKQNYDAILNDFEPFTSYAGLFLRKPVIMIDHQHSLLIPTNIHPSPTRHFFEMFSAFVAVNFSVPYFSHVFALDYVNKPIRYGRGTLFPLIWKPELNNYPVTVKDHYCVYLPYIPKKKILRVFSQFRDANFFVYGHDIQAKKNNIVFKLTSRKNFLEDLSSSKGVIAHTGFSLTWEISLLRKPLYTIPLTHHFEQNTNSYRMAKHNLAYVASDLSTDDLRIFIEETKKNNYKSSGNIKIANPSDFTRVLYAEIERQRNRLIFRRKRKS